MVDHVARAMTDGAPRAHFTARVMASVEGRPTPGFTARVMRELDAAGLDAPTRRPSIQRARPAFAGAPLLAAAGVVALVAMLASLSLPADPSLPIAPDAPRLAAWPYERAAIDVPPLPFDRWAPHPAAPRPHLVTIVQFDDADVYRIPALSPVSLLEVRGIEPTAPSVAPLAVPAPLAIADLRFNRETP